jgi:hypothetical protein
MLIHVSKFGESYLKSEAKRPSSMAQVLSWLLDYENDTFSFARPMLFYIERSGYNSSNQK